MGTAFYLQGQSLQKLGYDLEAMKTETEESIAKIGERVVVREVSINSLESDLVEQRKKVEELEHEVLSSREAADKKGKGVEELETKLSDTQQRLTQQIQVVSTQLQSHIQDANQRQDKVVGRINTIQQRMVGLDGQLLMMREEFLMKSAPVEEQIMKAIPSSSEKPTAVNLPISS